MVISFFLMANSYMLVVLLILNLVVWDALQVVGKLAKCVQAPIKFIRQSRIRL